MFVRDEKEPSLLRFGSKTTRSQFGFYDCKGFGYIQVLNWLL